ncbi:UNVERIFIED_CONTAM: hypothetical protein Scaly_0317500 [Sesamum calycinum]|uniref:CW-type domain-containing protein n=1 Tax=Sesamum calycinum TaxID=2727403 RepID=A0AAW2SB37_9LAMI
MTSSGRLKDAQMVGKRSLSEDRNTSKEKYSGKSSEKPLFAEKYPRFISHLAPPGTGPSSEAPIGMVPLVNEDWVSCDKCQKWRLLPLGTNPKSLPDKWLCRMLTWLPGMNRCNISEEETTNALRALYHPAASVPAPASENQQIQPNNGVVTSVGMASVDARYPDQEHQTVAAHTPTISVKKKPGSMKAANSNDYDGSTQSSNSRKKNLATSGKISNLNSGNLSPSPDGCEYQHMRQSSSGLEKYNDIKKRKKSLVNSSDKGTSLKIRSKREADTDGSRASKRIKSEELHFDDENCTSDNGGTPSKAGRASTSLSNNTSGSDRRKYNKDLSGEAKMNIPGTSDNGSLRSGKCDEKESVRKRKAKEQHGSQTHPEPISSSGRHLDSGDFMEEMCESDHRKEKKARVSKSGGKDTDGTKASVGTDRKNRGTKDQHNGQYLCNSQAADYLKSDVGSLQPPVAANSSSSKVSGSHRNKTSGQEVKGSPVESVSSSPLRLPKAEKVTSTSKKLLGKDDFRDSGSLAAVSPRRLSSGEDGRNDRTGPVKNDAMLTVNDHATDVYNDHTGHSNQYASVKQHFDQCKSEERPNTNKSHNSGSHSKKSGKGLSSHSKDKTHASGSELDKFNSKASDPSHDSLDQVHLYEEKSKSRRTRLTIDLALLDAIKSHDKKHNLQQEHGNEKLSKKSNQGELCGSGKSNSLPPLARVQTETVASIHPVSVSQKENGVKCLTDDAIDNVDAPKAPNQRQKAENTNGKPIRHPTPNSHRVRDVEASSPVRRDSSSHAANNALKEAKDLKHLADRLKNSGSTDSNGFYFQAALKFLHGASLLESGSSESTKHNDLMRSMQIYSSTAKLCEFCAHEYEKSKDMAAAALAYKCMEVAYMRVIYSSHTSANRDRNELQTALQIVPPGESPSSSASDLDNLNHQAASDKAALAKVVGSPLVSGSHIITSRSRSGFLRILNFAQDVNFAMEASRKSRIAFTAATSRLGETSHKEGISLLKKALDFNFQDVEGLLRRGLQWKPSTVELPLAFFQFRSPLSTWDLGGKTIQKISFSLNNMQCVQSPVPSEAHLNHFEMVELEYISPPRFYYRTVTRFGHAFSTLAPD